MCFYKTKNTIIHSMYVYSSNAVVSITAKDVARKFWSVIPVPGFLDLTFPYHFFIFVRKISVCQLNKWPKPNKLRNLLDDTRPLICGGGQLDFCFGLFVAVGQSKFHAFTT